MSHETLLAFAKKKTKPYNLAMRITVPSTRTLGMSASGITSIKFGFSPTNITSVSEVNNGNLAIPLPVGTTEVYFIVPVPTSPAAQPNSYLQINSGTGADLITEITHWDGFPLNRLAFNGLKALTKVPSVLWSACRDMEGMFSYCTAFNQALSWNTVNVTNMTSMFLGCSVFNQALNWNTVNVTTMTSMFFACAKFNQLLNFDTSNVTNMSNIFYGCSVFNQSVNFNTAKVTTMSNMFLGCSAFNQPVNFDTVKVKSMANMFSGCSVLNSPITLLTDKVTNIASMFSNCTVFNQDLSTTIFKSTVSRSGYDSNATAWIPANKPKFTA